MSDWRLIDTAPKDGSKVELLSIEGYAHEGYWDPEGDSWVDRDGNLGGECHHLEVTGFWATEHGWLQPDEVTHWKPTDS